MSTKIFITLPGADFKKSQAFHKALGFSFNPQFTDDNGACLIISEQSCAMLLTPDLFNTFIEKPMADARKETGVLIAISRESREAVDEIVASALKAGATEPREPQDFGFMYNRCFEDPDGHIWEPMWMDPGHVQ